MTNRVDKENGGVETMRLETLYFAGKKAPVVRGLEAGNIFQQDEVEGAAVAMQAQRN